MKNIRDGSGIANIVPAMMSSFNLYSNLWYYGVHRLCISYISYVLYSFPGWGCFDKIYLQGLMYISYKGNSWQYNPNIPMNMQRYPHVLGWYSLANDPFLECSSCVAPAPTFIPTYSNMSQNHLHFSSFSVVRWCFRTPRTILKYSRSCLSVRPYSNT